jgi:hypothetical protein
VATGGSSPCSQNSAIGFFPEEAKSVFPIHTNQAVSHPKDFRFKLCIPHFPNCTAPIILDLINSATLSAHKLQYHSHKHSSRKVWRKTIGKNKQASWCVTNLSSKNKTPHVTPKTVALLYQVPNCIRAPRSCGAFHGTLMRGKYGCLTFWMSINNVWSRHPNGTTLH